MSRIRSIHPGQWTDEDFVECSMSARLLTLGLRNEADDNGVFEWRPLRLKMRLFPADDVDVSALLDEVARHGLVKRFEVGERIYGAIRNFRVYQTPRSPKCEHPFPADVEDFVGSTGGDEAMPKRGPGRPRKSQCGEIKSSDQKSFPQNAENNSVMERRGEESNITPSELAIGEPISAPTSSAVAIIPGPDDVAIAFERYQALRAEIVANARPLTLDPDRRKTLAARLAQIGGAAGWEAVLAKIRGSPFLRGDTARDGKFVAQIDWVLKPGNLRKILDGNYDERSDRNRSGQAAGRSPLDAMATARSRLGVGG